MALTTSGMIFSSLEKKEDWQEFFLGDIKLPSKDACECAEIIFSKNLSGEDVLDLIFTVEVSDDNVFGLSMGHLIKTKRWLKNGQLSNLDISCSPSTSTNTIPVPKVSICLHGYKSN